MKIIKEGLPELHNESEASVVLICHNCSCEYEFNIDKDAIELVLMYAVKCPWCGELNLFQKESKRERKWK